MHGGGGRGDGEGQRSAKSEICNFVILCLSSCAVGLTRQLLSTTRAADRYAHTAGPPGGTPKIYQNFDKFGGDPWGPQAWPGGMRVAIEYMILPNDWRDKLSSLHRKKITTGQSSSSA